MVSFYGNMKNSDRICLLFDKVYTSRKEMEDNKDTDNIYNGRYVLVKYGVDGKPFADTWYIAASSSEVNSSNYSNYFILKNNEYLGDYYVKATKYDSGINYYKEDNVAQEDPSYKHSNLLDWQNYSQTYDATVWQKIWTANEEKYIMVGELRAQPPRIEVIADAPEVDDNNPHIDEYHSTIDNYKLHVPQNWKINNEIDFDYNVEGFDKAKRSIDKTVGQANSDDEITVTNSADAFNLYFIEENTDGTTYPEHEDYIVYPYVNENNYKNFYIKNTDNTYSHPAAADVYDSSLTYYKYVPDRAKYNDDGTIKKSLQNDQKKFVLDIPAIGNMMSDIWDLIYPIKWVEKEVDEDDFDDLKDELYTKDENVYTKLSDDADFDEDETYYIKDEDGNRDILISNRDGSVTIAPDTFAEIINKLLYLFGLDTDNEFKNMLNEYPRTIYGLYNAFSDLLGYPTDSVSAENYIPVSNRGWNTYGVTSQENYNNWHNSGFGPLFIKNENDVMVPSEAYESSGYKPFASGDASGVLSAIISEQIIYKMVDGTAVEVTLGDFLNDTSLPDDTTYTDLDLLQRTELESNIRSSIQTTQYYKYEYVQYYRDINSLWAFLREYQEERKDYRPEWTQDNPSSLKYIENRPIVVMEDDDAIAEFKVNNYVASDENEVYFRLVESDLDDGEDGYISAEYFAEHIDSLYIYDEDEYRALTEDDSWSEEVQYYYGVNLTRVFAEDSIETRWNGAVINPNGYATISISDEAYNGISGIEDLDSIIEAANAIVDGT